MLSIKPAIVTTACAGIRRMEAGQPPALGMQTFGGKGAGQWSLAIGCANREHPSRHWRQLQKLTRTQHSHRDDLHNIIFHCSPMHWAERFSLL